MKAQKGLSALAIPLRIVDGVGKLILKPVDATCRQSNATRRARTRRQRHRSQLTYLSQQPAFSAQGRTRHGCIDTDVRRERLSNFTVLHSLQIDTRHEYIVE